jgi:hypothetical protein
MKKLIISILLMTPLAMQAMDNRGITSDSKAEGFVSLIANGKPSVKVVVDDKENTAVKIAAENLSKDFGRVCGSGAEVVSSADGALIKVGTVESAWVNKSKIDVSKIAGKQETYLMQVADGGDITIIGSDRRGAVYGIYELSEQLGVSPWYDWADVPVEHKDNLWIKQGQYTNGEPAVKYRGIFLNDETPCLTSWVKNTYGTNYGDHRFYARVFELILRLRGNFMWPAMWSWAFYADDELNSKTADDMGVIMGTSHHEPMARNHQEYARHRGEYGAWNYAKNKASLDKFFTEGIERAKNTEDVITIGMRGDGDEAMSAEADVKLLQNVIKNQREIIKQVTHKSPAKTPQVWALYKEVLDYYDKGLKAPDDVILLLCDDNWGNVRRLPDAQERRHPGGWGMYYHVDYVGAPRNSKWMNMTPIQNMYEQLQLTYSYGVDRMWILNVGDLKPMEYPITLFLDMAWNPTRFSADNVLNHTRDFCAQQFGALQAAEAARILNLYCKYNGRVTAEMLDKDTYSLQTGEWRRVADEYKSLEADALRQYLTVDDAHRDAYKELILYPVQAMANLYDMYYSQAMNHYLYAQGDAGANEWADRVERAFNRDAELQNGYNHVIAGGKWNGMMTQKHIGYTEWNDNYPADKMPEVYRIEACEKGGFTFVPEEGAGCVAMEAEHYYSAEGEGWTVIPYLGRTLSGIAVMPYDTDVNGAKLNYRLQLPDDVNKVKAHVVVKSTLAFKNKDGHRYQVEITGGNKAEVNFNVNLNEAPENIYSVFYPTVARRVVESVVEMNTTGGEVTLSLTPLDPGIVFEKIVVDYGGYKPSYLWGEETPKKHK